MKLTLDKLSGTNAFCDIRDLAAEGKLELMDLHRITRDMPTGEMLRKMEENEKISVINALIVENDPGYKIGASMASFDMWCIVGGLAFVAWVFFFG